MKRDSLFFPAKQVRKRQIPSSEYDTDTTNDRILDRIYTQHVKNIYKKLNTIFKKGLYNFTIPNKQ